MAVLENVKAGIIFPFELRALTEPGTQSLEHASIAELLPYHGTALF
ncbi:hypothetical protein [Nitrosospira sp. Nsp2]|nr:hypothetical protein [Nitrosospira sp. Nsp2]